METLNSLWIDSPIGKLFAIANDKALLLLEFEHAKKRDIETLQLKKYFQAEIIHQKNAILEFVTTELNAYFEGTLKDFKTTIEGIGTDFQQKVWKCLLEIPYGETRSYADQSIQLGQPTATRAVANANGANKIAILIPCHRVIQKSGALGGYGGGIDQKKWLLHHEKNMNAKKIFF